MTQLSLPNKKKRPFIIKTLSVAIAAHMFASSYSHAGPEGGVVVGGAGDIVHSDNTTRIDQNTQRLSLEWDSFNVAVDERVEFVQPNTESVALNRILDNNGSSILGQIDANGRVILMNPNGIMFGEDATVDVGALVASGLDIDSSDFMNGELIFSGVDDTSGMVVNHGLINAATGGSAALLGKSVANHGLITAKLGHVALAAGTKAVVSFDDQGLIGVRIDQRTLREEVEGDHAVLNSGTLAAEGGNILLDASVSADLFSKAVNRGTMGGDTQAVVHDDGSFTLGGAGNALANTGLVDVSTPAGAEHDAGTVVMAANTVDQNGAVRANAADSNRAGEVIVAAWDPVSLGAASQIQAIATEGNSGKVSVRGDTIAAAEGAVIQTSGDIRLTGQDNLHVPQIQTHNLYLQSSRLVDQVAEIEASGETKVVAAAAAGIDLTNSRNDFHTLALDLRYNTDAQIYDRNDIALKDIHVVGSSVSIESLGEGATLSQTADSRIELLGGTLILDADRVILGDNGSSTHVHHSRLIVRFDEYVDTNESITLFDDFAPMPTSAGIYGGADLGSITVVGNEEIDLSAEIDAESSTLTIGHLRGREATVSEFMETQQTGPIHLRGALTWDAWGATLDHPENDIAFLEGTVSATPSTEFLYVDQNDITLRDFTESGFIGSVDITSLGEGATIRQAPNTALTAGHIYLDADNIELGANGSSEMNAWYNIDLTFSDDLVVNGPYSLSNSTGAAISITGDDSDNDAFFGQYATASPFMSVGSASFDVELGSGDDSLVFANDLVVEGGVSQLSIEMGDGDDWLAFVQDLVVRGSEVSMVEMSMGNGDDSLVSTGDFIVDSSVPVVNIDMARGDDWALFANGLTTTSSPSDDAQVSMGGGDDTLLFRRNLDVPTTVGAGRDFVLAIGANDSFEIVDLDPEEDQLVAIP